jgi:hypothetical protein
MDFVRIGKLIGSLFKKEKRLCTKYKRALRLTL